MSKYDKFDNEEQEIRTVLSQIKVNTDGLVEGVKSQINNKGLRRISRIKGFSLAIALVAILTITTTVFAAGFGDFDWFMERFNPSFAKVVEPVGIYAEDQDIRMEIIGAQSYGNMAVIYLSIQDISGENRLTESMWFFCNDPAIIDKPECFVCLNNWHMNSSNWNMLYFDERTNTAYFEIMLVTHSLIPDSWEIGVCGIVFDGTCSDVVYYVVYYNEPIPLSLADIGEVLTMSIVSEDHINLRVGHRYVTVGSIHIADRLVPEEILIPSYYTPVVIYGEPDAWISNIGIINEKLHIQIGRHFNKCGLSLSSFMLIAPNGEMIYAFQAIKVIIDEDFSLVSNRKRFFDEDALFYCFREYIFDVDINDLQYYTLFFRDIIRSHERELVEGDWRIAVNTSDTSHQRIVLKNDIPTIDGDLFEFMILNPLSFQATGSYVGNLRRTNLQVETTEGLVALKYVRAERGYFYSQRFNGRWLTEVPIDIATVTAIIINELRIPIP